MAGLTFRFTPGAFAKSMQAKRDLMARAATGAMNEAAELGKAAGRASIAGGGFSTRWQNAFRAKVYPEGQDSLKPAAFFYHKIDYAGVFESGAQITGKPLLWLPIDQNLPLNPGGARLTPATLAASLGKLTYVKRNGKPPLLMANVAVGPAGGIRPLPSKANSRKGARARAAYAGDRMKTVPVFVGISTVNISKKFSVIDAVQAVGRQLPALYFKHLRKDNQ